MTFYIISFLMIAAAMMVIFFRNPIYSAIALVATLLLQAVLFVSMQAYLVAALQVLLYAGAIVVLILFVIMMLDLTPKKLKWRSVPVSTIAYSSAAFYLTCVIGLVLWFFYKRSDPSIFSAKVSDGTVENVANILISKYALPFELTAVLLLIAIIGAVVMAKDEKRS